MKSYTIILMVFLFVAQKMQAQKSACNPQNGNCKTCDSIEALYRDDATFAVYMDTKDSSCPWKDSLYLPEKVIAAYQRKLVALYNWFPDSLAKFRLYHYGNMQSAFKEFTLTPFP